ncbi:unnamed protein product, partial [Phaeothamnion confervicola]
VVAASGPAGAAVGAASGTGQSSLTSSAAAASAASAAAAAASAPPFSAALMPAPAAAAAATRLFRPLLARMGRLATVNGHRDYPVFSVKFDKTGNYVLSGADDYLVKVWSARSGRLLLSLRGHSNVVTDLVVSPDNAVVATAAEDRLVRLWRLRDGHPVAVLAGHTHIVNRVEFDPFEDILVSASDDGTCRLWDLRDRGRFVDGNADPQSLALRQAPSQEGVGTVNVKCLSMCPFGRWFAVGGSDGVGRVWRFGFENDGGGGAGGGGGSSRGDAAPGGVGMPRQASASPEREWEDVTGCGSSASGESGSGGVASTPAVVAMRSNSAGRRDCAGEGAGARAAAGESGAAAAARRAFPLPVLQEEAASAGAAAAAVSAADAGVGGALYGNLVCQLRGHVAAVTDIAFSNRGDRLLTGSMEDGTARVWSWGRNFRNLRHVVIKVFHDAVGAANSAAGGAGRGNGPHSGGAGAHAQAGHDGGGGARAGMAAQRGRVRRGPRIVMALDNVLWTSDDRRIVTSQSTRVGGGDSAAAAPTGSWQDQRLKVWDSASGTLLRLVLGHASAATAVASHPGDAAVLVSAGHDGIVTLWDTETGKAIRRFRNAPELAAVPTPAGTADRDIGGGGGSSTGGVPEEDLDDDAVVVAIDGGRGGGRVGGAAAGVTPHPAVGVVNYDCCFSPDGATLAVSGLGGRFSLFGFGPRLCDTAVGRNVPNEQYFSTDYNALNFDARHNAVDVNADLPPHLVPLGVLTMANGQIYPPQYQPKRSELVGPSPLLAADVATWQQRLVAGLEDLDRLLRQHEERIHSQSYGWTRTG